MKPNFLNFNEPEDSVVSILRIKPILEDLSTPSPSHSRSRSKTPNKSHQLSQQNPTRCLLPISPTQVNHFKSGKDFRFSRVFTEESTNKEIFKYTVVPNLEGVLKGISFCVFTYGQTSSGKTFTMRGNIWDARRTVDWLESYLGPHSSEAPILSDKRRLREPQLSVRRELASPISSRKFLRRNQTPVKTHQSQSAVKRISIERTNRLSFHQSIEFVFIG